MVLERMCDITGIDDTIPAPGLDPVIVLRAMALTWQQVEVVGPFR